MSSADLYATLGVSRNANITDIRSAYKDLAKVHHPDRGGNPDKFKEISLAHEILSNDEKRKMYDITGSVEEKPNQGSPFGDGMPDFFGQMFGGMFGGMHGGPGGPGGPGSHGGHGGPNRRSGKGPGKSQDIPLRISDYYLGKQFSIKLSRQAFCKSCKGSGALSVKQCATCNGQGQVRQIVMMGPMQMINQGPCPHCRGAGKESVGKCNECQGKCFYQEDKTLEIKIEPGMISGNTLVFPGLCSDNPSHNEAGDVTMVLREAEEDGVAANWTRDGSRLKTSIKITLAEALLGTTKVLQGHPGFPNGVPIEIPVGVQNLWIGALPGLGMPIRGTPKFGEAVITVLVIPSDNEIAALKSAAMKDLLPAIPEVPVYTGVVNVGTWGAI